MNKNKQQIQKEIDQLLSYKNYLTYPFVNNSKQYVQVLEKYSYKSKKTENIILYTIVIEINLKDNKREYYVHFDPSHITQTINLNTFPLFNPNDTSGKLKNQIKRDYLSGKTVLESVKTLKTLISSFPIDYTQKMKQVKEKIKIFQSQDQDMKINQLDAAIRDYVKDCEFMKKEYEMLKLNAIEEIKKKNAERLRKTMNEIFKEGNINKEEFDSIEAFIDQYLSNPNEH